jgi:NAD(P)-dependent dehydrogenase (short-subunit alcohol dehydrogenase family)
VSRYFRDKIAVVTAAGSGIGRALALALAEQGARVHLVDIREDRLERVFREAQDRGGQVIEHVVDCTDPVEVEDLADAIYASDGRADILINGVGVLVAAPVETLRPRDWRRAIDGNLWSVIHGVQAFVPRMLTQRGRSHLVNIASIEGLVGFPFTVPYATTKFAVVGLSEALNAELAGRGIDVTVVCPSMVRSNLMGDGLLRLPGTWSQRVQGLHDRFGPSPERLARQVLRAIRRRRSLVVPSWGFLPPWLLKRLSAGLYHGLARQLVRSILWLEPGDYGRIGRSGDKEIIRGER